MPRYPIDEGHGSHSDRSQSDIEEQAAMWVSRIDCCTDLDLDDADASEFHHWLRADPRHASEYRVQAAIVQMARDLPPDVLVRLRARDRRSAAVSRMFSLPRFAIAAGALAIVFASIFAGIRMHARLAPGIQAAYSTRTAETRSIHLGDGSVMELNTRSRVQWSLDRQERQVNLMDGEVYFDVAHDARRPFRVIVGRSQILAIGTRFTVFRKHPDTVVLTVVDGVVQVTAYEPGNTNAIWVKRFVAPRKVEYQLNGVIQEQDDFADALQWREGLVRFRQRSLTEAVEDLRRYTDRRVVLDQRLENLQVGGLYSTQDVTGDFTRIAESLPMTIHDDGNVIELGLREEGSSRDR